MSLLRLVVAALSIAALGVVLSSQEACDPWPDTCDEGASSCEGNTVVSCVRPGAEAHASEARHDCGSDALCFVASDTRGALCARKGADKQAVTCDTANEQSCPGSATLSTCVPNRVGSNYWVDEPCGLGYHYDGVTSTPYDTTCQPALVPADYDAGTRVPLTCR